MEIKDLKKHLNETETSLGLACLMFSFSKNLKIKLNEMEQTNWVNPEEMKPSYFEFYAQFYDCEYRFLVTQQDIDDNYESIQCEGQSILFTSFIDLIQDDYWEHIKLIADRFFRLEYQELISQFSA